MAVTVGDLRARVETDLDNDTLQRILDANVQAIDRSAGKATPVTEVKRPFGSVEFATTRPAASGVSVKERRRIRGDQVTLAADDYRQVGGVRFVRLGDGTNPAACWGAEVEIDFQPEVDEELRDRVTLDLSQVDIKFNAYDREKVADWEGEQRDSWKQQRAGLLAQIREGSSSVI